MSHHRIICLWVAFSWGLWLSPAWAESAAAPAVKALVVLDLEMTGDLSDERKNAEWQQRRGRMSEALREKLNGSGLYAVVDGAKTLRAVADSGAAAPLHSCNGCELDIAKRLHAQYVLSGWVFRVSNLVLSLNVEIKEAASGRSVFLKGFDFRGDNDQGWLRAIDYFVKALKDRSQESPA